MGILNPPTPTWRSVDLTVLLACLTLMLWYGALGYLAKPAERIRGSDSIGYYVYLPSIFMDGDLDLGDDFRTLGGPNAAVHPAPGGKAGNIFSIGPAILWLPWFTVGHFVALATTYPADGYSAPYTFAVYWGNVAYVFLGLLLTIRFLRTFDLDQKTVTVSILATLLLTQLTYYFLPMSATSHGVSFTTVALFLLSVRKTGVNWKSGLLGGLAVLVRWQNLILLPLIVLADHFDRNGRRITRDHFKKYLIFTAVVVLVFLPQSLAWYEIYGSPALIPQSTGYLDPTRLPVLEVLFSLRHGLFTWHPIWLVVSVCALFPLRNITWVRIFILSASAQLAVNAMVEDWWGNWSFGQRRFVNLLPLLALVLGLTYSRVPIRYRTRSLIVLAVLLAFNQALLYQYHNVLIPRSGKPTLEEFVWDKFSLWEVGRAQLAVNTAVRSFRRNDFENFLRFAESAHEARPNYRNTVKVRSVASAVEGKLSEALEGYDRWLEIEPGNPVPLWGIADIRLKLGQVGQARELMIMVGVQDPQITAALESGKGTLLTGPFFDRYRKELDQIYLD